MTQHVIVDCPYFVFGQYRIAEGLITWQSHISSWSRRAK
jgi:hypothetical protein